MRLVLNILLLAGIAFLVYLLYYNIKEPIEFQAEKNRRMNTVVDRLMDIRTAQEIYRDITGEFAGSFDTLEYVLGNMDIPQYKVIGDPDDPNSEYTVDTIYFDTQDSLVALGITLDSLRYIPYASKMEFDIAADTLTYQQTLVSVCQVGTQWRNFMGRFGVEKYAKYDKSYDPNDLLKFGNLNAPNLSGNWE